MNTKSISKKSMNKQIDFSEIPKTTEEFWADAKVKMPTGKTTISIPIDDNILDFFKKQGKGYQAKINAVLKSYIEHTT